MIPIINLLKSQSAGFVWEFMFTRSSMATRDMQRQHELLSEVAMMLDNHKIRSTLNKDLGSLSPDNLRQAHQLLESGESIGKLVLSGI